MIGALANQRAMDIINYPEQQAEAVASLREHTVLHHGVRDPAAACSCRACFPIRSPAARS